MVGSPTAAVTIRVRISTGGAIGAAPFVWSSNGGSTWQAAQVVPSGGILNQSVTPPTYLRGGEVGLGSTGLRARFTDRTYASGEEWSFVLAHPVGYPIVAGTGFAAELAAVEAALWWTSVSATHIALPDVYAGIDTRTNFQTMYITACNTLAARCNALAAVYAPRLGGS